MGSQKMSDATRFLVIGEPASKANSRKIVSIHGVPASIKSDKARKYAKSFLNQVRPLPVLLTGDLVVHITIHYASRRPDLDESLILDLLQGVAYANDRQVRERHVYWRLDRDNPRAEIEVRKMQPVPEGIGAGPERRGGAERKSPARSRVLGAVSKLPGRVQVGRRQNR
jgi:Holliday junction resolvase RusA-like endonuclease